MKLEKIIQQTNNQKPNPNTSFFSNLLLIKKNLPRQINELFPYFFNGNGFSNILAEFVRLHFVEFKLFFIAKQYFERFLSSKLVGY
jgi:hypothetical protein